MIIDDDMADNEEDFGDMLTDEELAAMKEEPEEVVQEGVADVEASVEEQVEAEEPESEASADTGEEEEVELEAEEEAPEEKPLIDRGSTAQVFVSDASEDIPEQMTKLEALYETGDLDTAAFLRERDKLVLQSHEAAMMEKLTAQSAKQAWDRDIDIFMAENPIYGDPLVAGALVAVYQQEEFLDLHGNKSGYVLLNEARKIVDARFNLSAKADTPEPKDKPLTKEDLISKKKEALKGRGDSTKEMPQTLGGVPSASESIESSKFSHMDNLTGFDLEKAIDAMSEADQDIWLTNAH